MTTTIAEHRVATQGGAPVDTALTAQLERLFAVAWIPAVNVAIAAVVALILWGPIHGALLIAWLATMALLSVARIVFARHYATEPGAMPPESWARRHVIGSGLTGLVWGADAAVLQLTDDPAAHLLIAMVTAGMCGGALAASFTHLPSFRAFLLGDMSLFILGFALHGGPNYLAIAAMGLAFTVVLDRICVALNQGFLSTVALRTQLVDSERRMRDFAETASDWFWEQDAQLRFTYMSLSNERHSGMTAGAHLGKTRRETKPEGISEAEFSAHEADLEARREFSDFRFSRTLPDGTRRHLSISGKPVFGPRGEFLGYRGTGTDITNLVRAEAELRESERRFRDFAESASHWVWETDREHRFAFVTEGCEHVAGIPSTQFIGRRSGELAASLPEGRTAIAEPLRRMTAHEAFMGVRVPMMTPDGRALTLEVSGKPIFDSQGAFVGYRGITRDITAQRAAEAAAEEMRSARDVAAAADQLKTRFLASISHELRTPLNAIIGFSEIMALEMLGPVGNAAYKDYARNIRDSGQHLLDLINDLLDMSRIELGHYRLAESEVRVAELAEMSAALVRATLKGGDVVIRADEVDPRLAIWADRRAIRQVLINLLSNAARAAPAGSEVRIAAVRPVEGDVEIVVSDSGTGITPEQLEQIFKPFSGPGPEHARQSGGTGLGLWISRSLVENHGGTLVLDSVVGRGTRAIVRIPIWRAVSAKTMGARSLSSSDAAAGGGA